MQKRCNSSALALELHPFCIQLLICNMSITMVYPTAVGVGVIPCILWYPPAVLYRGCVVIDSIYVGIFSIILVDAAHFSVIHLRLRVKSPFKLVSLWIYKKFSLGKIRSVALIRMELNSDWTVMTSIFSCDQAALQMVFSVCLSVCLSVCHTFFTMFPSSYHHEIFRSYYHGQKWCPCKRSRSEVKGQGHRGQHPT